MHRAVDWNPFAWCDEYRIFCSDIPERNADAGSVPPNRRGGRQKIQQVADGATTAADSQPFEHLGKENERRNHQRREELADGQRRQQRDRHRQLHRHPALADILPRLVEDRPAPDQRSEESQHAQARERYPDSEPHGGSDERSAADAHQFLPFDAAVLDLARLRFRFVGHGSIT